MINSLIILDCEGNRLFVKYYDKRPKTQQIDFESFLHKKTKTINAKNDRKRPFAPDALSLHAIRLIIY